MQRGRITRKPNLDAYAEWMLTELGVDLDRAQERYYTAAVSELKSQIAEWQFWKTCLSQCEDWEDEFLVLTGYRLFMDTRTPPVLVSKPYTSVVDKSWRRNFRDNKRFPRFPSPPGDQWIEPENWLSSLNDIVRTRFFVKYLDGAAFLAEKLEHLAREQAHIPEVRFVAREDGYHAVHFEVRDTFKITSRDWEQTTVQAALEIQITTQLKDAISDLLRNVYEERRLSEMPKDWRWDLNSKEFNTGYLGHVMHYLEGQIVQVRRNGNND